MITIFFEGRIVASFKDEHIKVKHKGKILLATVLGT